MLGAKTLLINPPLINGIAFTRQGRCQEREDVLGTTKPPYTLAVVAALLRGRGLEVRLIDQTAERLSTEEAIARLGREGFVPTLIIFSSATPTLDADVVEMAKLKRHFGVPLFCFGPHASTAPRASMERALDVDGMVVGEPEDALVRLSMLDSLEGASAIPSLTLRRQDTIVDHQAHGTYLGFTEMPAPAWDLVPLHLYKLPLVGKSYAIVETSRGCPYACDFCVAPIIQGHKFRERSAKHIIDEIETLHRERGLEYFYFWGDTVTLNAKTFSEICGELIGRNLKIKWFANARADNLVDPAFVQRLRRAGCWMLSMGIESASDDTRQEMLKRLDRHKIRIAFENLREADIKSFAFFIYGYPGDTSASMERTTDYALELDPDFANFYPAVPYPGTTLYDKCIQDGLLPDEDWSKMEYSYYLLQGQGLNEKVVMDAIARAKRRFFVRPKYFARHWADIVRLSVTKSGLAWQQGQRLLFKSHVPSQKVPAPAALQTTQRM